MFNLRAARELNLQRRYGSVWPSITAERLLGLEVDSGFIGAPRINFRALSRTVVLLPVPPQARSPLL